jgi:hypothetical protein
VVEARDVGSRLVVADIDGTPIEKELMTDGKNEIIAIANESDFIVQKYILFFATCAKRCVQDAVV